MQCRKMAQEHAWRGREREETNAGKLQNYEYIAQLTLPATPDLKPTGAQSENSLARNLLIRSWSV